MEALKDRDEAESSSSNGQALSFENGDKRHELLEKGEVKDENEPLKPKAVVVKHYYGIGFTSLILVGLITLLQTKDTVTIGATTGVFSSLKVTTEAPRGRDLVFAQQQWSSDSHTFQPNVSDWDEQRAALFLKHPKLKPKLGERPRTLMVTGSSPDSNESPVLSHLRIRAGKNKLDYCRKHGLQLYYNIFGEDPEFSNEWAKLPVIRMLMLQHPEVEWIWWLDADAIFTNISFTPPLAELEYHNLVLNGEDGLVYDKWDRAGLSTGAYLIRNCQWSLDLLGVWANGAGQTARSGNIQNEEDSGNDLSSLVTLLEKDKSNPVEQQRWVPRVKLVMDEEAATNEESTKNLSSGELDSERMPSVSHIYGCLPSKPASSAVSSANFDTCVKQLERAMEYADRQVLDRFEVEPLAVGDVTNSTHGEDDAFAERSSEFKFQPPILNWDEKRQAYITARMAAYPNAKPKRYHHRVLLAGETAPQPCSSKVGSSLLLRVFKNWVDYGRVQGFKNFYNMAVIDKNFTGSWSKIPLIRKLMVNNPEVEWIWWIDDDAVFTSMDFRLPFETYDANGYNFVMWGNKHDIFYERKYNAINTGNFLIRNCQWSLDLLDRWASFGASHERQMRANSIMTTVLDGPDGWVPDDQTAMVYLLITERLKWAPRVYFEQDIVMSGDWAHWTKLYLDQVDLSADDRPLVTHFTGCQLCAESIDDSECLQGLQRTLNFADNQLLEYYGLRHVSLNSSSIKVRLAGDLPEHTASEIERYVQSGGKMNLTELKDGEVTSEQDRQPRSNEPEIEVPIDENFLRVEEELQEDEDELNAIEDIKDSPKESDQAKEIAATDNTIPRSQSRRKPRGKKRRAKRLPASVSTNSDMKRTQVKV